jgi:hypothetical protein
MDFDTFVRLPEEQIKAIPSVVEVPEDARRFWLSSTQSENSFFPNAEPKDVFGENRNIRVADLSYEDFDRTFEFIRSREVSPFRNQIAKDLSQPFGVRVFDNLGLNQRKIANPVAQRQRDLVGQMGNPTRVSSMGDAVAHWQYIGNQNIQSFLRTGDISLPFGTPSFDFTVDALTKPNLGGTLADRAAVERYFLENAAKSIRYLDDFVAGSSKHGGFTGFRGVNTNDALKILGINDISLLSARWVGTAISDPGYMAVSLSPNRAARFSTSKDGNSVNGVVFQVDVPRDLPAGSVSGSIDTFMPSFYREHEMLLPRGTRFEIVDVVTDKNWLTYDEIDAIVRIRPIR